MRSQFPKLLLLALVLVPVACDSQPTATLDLVATQVAVGKAAAATLTAEIPSATRTPPDTATPVATETLAPTLLPSRTTGPTPLGPPTVTLIPSPAPTSTPTTAPSPVPTPTPKREIACRPVKKGWIGFKRQKRCNSTTGEGCGPVEIWIMKPDGSKQARMCDRGPYDQGLFRDRTSPDGTWRLEVTGRPTNIYRLFLNTGHQEMIIVNNRKDWDPVVSSDGWWLAWVTNRNANDEIYIKTIEVRDGNQRRLTVNEWEWDKHPTWSPDGTKIAFYSNRADTLNEATRQIWVMDVVDDRAANLRNLSKRPGKVDTDPVWFKWDGMP